MPVDRSMKVLLVEDSKITRRMELKALNELGFTNVVEADDGNDAIAKLQQHADIGLVISDWNMPGMSGFDLLEWVRGTERLRELPFIMATARGEKRETAKATQAGVSSLIIKPFGPPELNSIIEKVFRDETESAAQAAMAQPERKRLSDSGRLLLNVAHIQITDHLGLGVLKHLMASSKLTARSFELETRCMAGWNPVQQALESGEVDAAFVLAPIAMDLFAYEVPIKLILLAHKNGSICVRRKRTESTAALREFLRNKTFYIPHMMSIHHMLAHMFLREIGMNPGVPGTEGVNVFFEVVPPVRMPEFLGTNPDAAGFLVAEPMGTKAIAEGIAEQLFLSGELWEYHPCCVLAVRDEVVNDHPEALQEFCNLLVQAGDFIYKRPESAAEVGVGFLDPNKTLGLKVPILKNVLKENKGIRTNDLFPVAEDFERIQQYMNKEMGIGNLIDINRFVDTRFAEVACRGMMAGRRRSTLRAVSSIAQEILSSQDAGGSAKTMLGKEGKYLFFTLANQEYGIGISSVKEVIRMMPIRTVPYAPDYMKGVVNLRGKVIPLLDLGIKFGLGEREYGERSCIIILDIERDDDTLHIGIVVDSVSEVVTIKAQDTEEMQSLCGDTSYILAMAKIGNGVKILLNAARLFSESETQMTRRVA